MKKIFFILLLIPAFFIVKVTISYNNGLVSDYPGDIEFSPSFDDINPIWGQDGLTLSFERIYKSGEGRSELFLFLPFGEKPTIKSILADYESINGRNFYSGFCWVGIEKNIHKYIYSIGPNLYIGQTDFSDNKPTKNVLFSSEDGGNKYADYSDKNKMVAFISGITGNGDIYVKRLDNNEVIRITYTDFLESSPKWSPDGESLVYSSLMNGNMDIYVITNIKDVVLQGAKANTVQLTKSFLEETNPTWSPDGNLIAYYSLRNKVKETSANVPKFLEINIFDIGVVDLKGKSVIVVEDVYRQEKKGPVWVSFPEVQDQYIFFVRSEYKNIEAINVSQYLNYGQIDTSVITGLIGYKFGNITDIDCKVYKDEKLGHRLNLVYSAMIANFQKRIYCASIKPFIEKEKNKIDWNFYSQHWLVEDKKWETYPK